MSAVPVDPAAQHIIVGRSCLLNVMSERFMVSLLEVDDDTIRVSFPGRDYPIPGTPAQLEFHDSKGFDLYEAEVIEGPAGTLDGITLTRPRDSQRTQHRDACRVPTDLTVQIKDNAHVRRYDAALLNLSLGGALVETEADFGFQTTVETTLSLPGEPAFRLLGRIAHITEPGRVPRAGSQLRLFGIRFTSLDPEVEAGLSRYVNSRMRDLYARGDSA